MQIICNVLQISAYKKLHMSETAAVCQLRKRENPFPNCLYITSNDPWGADQIRSRRQRNRTLVWYLLLAVVGKACVVCVAELRVGKGVESCLLECHCVGVRRGGGRIFGGGGGGVDITCIPYSDGFEICSVFLLLHPVKN